MIPQALTITFLTVLAFPAVGADPLEIGTCMRTVTIHDPAGDESTWALEGTKVVAYPALDLLEYNLSETNDVLILALTLAQRPMQAQMESYRYWIGFDIRIPDGTTHYMDARIAATTTYDRATVIGPVAWDLPSLEEVSVEWDGATMVMMVNKSRIQDMVGTTDIVFGKPHASSDGPHRTTMVQGSIVAHPYTVDRLGDGLEFAPMGPCQSANRGVASAGTAEADSERPLPGTLASWTAFALLTVALWCRRRE